MTSDGLGATVHGGCTTFAVWAPNATAVELCLFAADGTEARLPMDGEPPDPWRVDVPGIGAGQRYGYRAHGPYDPLHGCRFNPNRLLLDPYARALAGDLDPTGPVLDVAPDDPTWSADSAGHVPRSVVVDPGVDPSSDWAFDWAGDVAPRTTWADTVIYEAHVRGLTMRHPGVPDQLRGTYAGLAHPAVVDELLGLGVTAIELLPVHHFVTEPAVAARGLVNYWGYNSVGFFAPHGVYSSVGDGGGQVAEFKQMVRSLHAAGIEVLLDVVYNHTGESGEGGPTLFLRGLDDGGYYRHRSDGTYDDVTGCGNTVAADSPPGLRLVVDSLRYWVDEMHVDGFRFDLAPALLRTGKGVDLRAPLLAVIESDPVLARTKLVAEPWDATSEGYLVGRFPPPWREWNDRFRDTVRDFWRGRSGGVGDLAYRLSGSSDLYAPHGEQPSRSVNFVTAHDGFTLRDLVSYERRHNDANGEQSRDGTGDNRSWNCGAEGETEDPDVVALRRRQAANLLGTLLLSTGVPMLVAGDERGRTQGGNNNAYCHDGPAGWVDWSVATVTDEGGWSHLTELTRQLLALRRRHLGLLQVTKDPIWIHPSGREMEHADWFDNGLATLGMLRAGRAYSDRSYLVWLHAGAEPITLPAPGEQWPSAWDMVVDTSGSCTHTDGGLLVPGRTLLLLGTG